MLPHIVVSYVVGLGIEFAMAQIKKEEVPKDSWFPGCLSR
jgi:Na+-transporting NADH:ubiquinone oxidoreductase subunit B